MQFGRIDGNAYILDFQYPFSAVQAFAVALANVTQRLKWNEQRLERGKCNKTFSYGQNQKMSGWPVLGAQRCLEIKKAVKLEKSLGAPQKGH